MGRGFPWLLRGCPWFKTCGISSTIQIQSNTPKTFPRHNSCTNWSQQKCPDNKRSQHMPTDISWRQQTLSAIFKQHLGGSWDVRECLFVCVHFKLCMNSALGMFWGYWIVFVWCLWTFIMFGCVWGIILVLIPCRMVNLHRFDIVLKGNIFFNWPFWNIKISKCPDISSTKMVGFCHFLAF